MKLSLLSLLLLVGCGGDPFTTDLLRVSNEAGDDVVSETGDQDSGVDTDSDTPDAKTDAKPQHDGGHDSGELPDSGVADADAAQTCTPLNAHTVVTDAGCASSITYPEFFQIKLVDNSVCSDQVTPPVCQCQETYNCACITAYDMQGACVGGGTWVGCTMADDVVIVSCTSI